MDTEEFPLTSVSTSQPPTQTQRIEGCPGNSNNNNNSNTPSWLLILFYVVMLLK